ncbi:MAG TPA: alpha/beta fold hydrolase, partial [Candidatus Deferrimicrobium sp.]
MGGKPVNPRKSEAVVLIHGLWMTGTEMRVLGGRLEESGFRVRYFRYHSWRGGLAQAADALREFVEATEGERVHLVGHSLGGVVIAKMLEEAPRSRPGRVAMLGSPMGGSATARIVSRCRVGRWLVGGVIREGIVEHAP